MEVLYFYADWCSSCQILKPHRESLEKNFTSFRFKWIDIDEHPQVAAAFRIRNVPAFVVYKDGSEKDRMAGTFSLHEVEEFLKNNLKTKPDHL